MARISSCGGRTEAAPRVAAGARIPASAEDAEPDFVLDLLAAVLLAAVSLPADVELALAEPFFEEAGLELGTGAMLDPAIDAAMSALWFSVRKLLN